MACEICKKPYLPPTDDCSLDSDEKPHLCKVCGKSFSLKIQLKRHLLTHEANVPYICNACEKNLDRSSSYNLRFSKKGSFTCETCNKSFTTKRSLLRHAGEHTLENNLTSYCDVCGESFKNSTALKRHVTTTHKSNRGIISRHPDQSSYHCQECGKFFTELNQFEAHCADHRMHHCKGCDLSFASSPLLQDHLHSCKLKRSSQDCGNWDDKRHACSICDKSFSRKSALEGHLITHLMESHESPVEDDSDKDMDFKCNLKDDKANELCLPKLKIRRSYSCEKCPLVFSSKLSLNKHKLSHNADSEIQKMPEHRKMYSCRTCSQTFDCKEAYKQHKLSHNAITSSDSSREKVEKTYTCQICFKIFAKKKHLKKHIGIHLDDKCEGESDRSKTEDAAELTTEEDTNMCQSNSSSSDDKFLKSNSLDEVKFLSPKKEKRAKIFSCGHCGKRFAGETCWKKHEAKHADDREDVCQNNKGRKGKKAKVLICEYCNEDFTGKRHLFIKHKLSHTPEVCGICDARFTDRASLREHCRIHIGTEEGRRFLECSQKVLDAKNGIQQQEPKVEYIYLVLR